MATIYNESMIFLCSTQIRVTQKKLMIFDNRSIKINFLRLNQIMWKIKCAFPSFFHRIFIYFFCWRDWIYGAIFYWLRLKFGMSSCHARIWFLGIDFSKLNVNPTMCNKIFERIVIFPCGKIYNIPIYWLYNFRWWIFTCALISWLHYTKVFWIGKFR